MIITTTNKRYVRITFISLALLAGCFLAFAPHKALAASITINKAVVEGSKVTITYTPNLSSTELAKGIYTAQVGIKGTEKSLRIIDRIENRTPYKSPADLKTASVSFTIPEKEKQVAAYAVIMEHKSDGSATFASAMATKDLVGPSASDVRTMPARYSYKTVDGSVVATVSWDPVKDATHYVITRETGSGGTVVVSGSTSVALNDATSESRFEGLEAADRFTVRAIQHRDGTNITLAQGSAKDADVVRAQTEFGSIANIGEYAQRVMKYALPFGIILGILATIYAGITLMLSQGSPDKVKSAQEAIQGAIFGLVILILTRLMVDFLFIPSIDTQPNQPNFFSHTTPINRSVHL